MGKIVWDENGVRSVDDNGNETPDYVVIRQRLEHQLSGPWPWDKYVEEADDDADRN